MGINFFILLTIAIALGVYIGRDPSKHIKSLIGGSFESIWSFLKFLLWMIPISLTFYIIYQISSNILNYLNSSTTAPVNPLLIILGAVFIGAICTFGFFFYLSILIDNIKDLGFKKGLQKTWQELNAEYKAKKAAELILKAEKEKKIEEISKNKSLQNLWNKIWIFMGIFLLSLAVIIASIGLLGHFPSIWLGLLDIIALALVIISPLGACFYLFKYNRKINKELKNYEAKKS